MRWGLMHQGIEASAGCLPPAGIQPVILQKVPALCRNTTNKTKEKRRIKSCQSVITTGTEDNSISSDTRKHIKVVLSYP